MTGDGARGRLVCFSLQIAQRGSVRSGRGWEEGRRRGSDERPNCTTFRTYRDSA